MCGMIAYQATISGANLILKRDPHGGSSQQGRVRRGLATPRAGTFARAG
jgi:hypothetical protein